MNLQSGNPASTQRAFSLRILLMSFSQSDDHIKVDPDLRPLSQDSSSLARGRPQIPVEPARFFSSVTETQHPEGLKSQRPEINGFAQITWHTGEKLGFSLSSCLPLFTLFVQLFLTQSSTPSSTKPPPLSWLWSAGLGCCLEFTAAEQQTSAVHTSMNAASDSSSDKKKQCAMRLFLIVGNSTCRANKETYDAWKLGHNRVNRYDLVSIKHIKAVFNFEALWFVQAGIKQWSVVYKITWQWAFTGFRLTLQIT